MNGSERREREELERLFADRALDGLAAADEARLDELLRAYPDVAADELDLAAAALSLAFIERIEPLPASLGERIARQLQRSM